VADSSLQIQHAYGVPLPGRFGRQDGDPGVRVEVHGALSICTIQPFRGRRAACAAALKNAIEFDLPATGRSNGKGRDMLAWSGPDMFVAISADPTLAERLRKALGGNAAIVDQSDGKVLFRVSGRDARALLEKGVTVDLHPRAFAAGHVALTLLSHLSAQIIQCDDAPTYEIVLSRAFAADFWHWLEESAGEFGLTLSEYGNSR
jgi:heterotetrameric sarcosine oxidase gamma subunit